MPCGLVGQAGGNAAGTGTAVLSTPNDVTVSSTDTQTDQALVQSDVSKPKTSTGGAAVDLAFAIDLCVQAVDTLYPLIGGRGLISGDPVQRAWRDVHAVQQHIALVGR